MMGLLGSLLLMRISKEVLASSARPLLSVRGCPLASRSSTMHSLECVLVGVFGGWVFVGGGLVHVCVLDVLDVCVCVGCVSACTC